MIELLIKWYFMTKLRVRVKKMKWKNKEWSKEMLKKGLKKKCNMQKEEMKGKLRSQPMEHGHVIDECLFV